MRTPTALTAALVALLSPAFALAQAAPPAPKVAAKAAKSPGKPAARPAKAPAPAPAPAPTAATEPTPADQPAPDKATAPTPDGEKTPAKGAAAPSGNDERPWAKGVSEDAQREALALFREGNGLLKESVFVQAAARYREALARWDHPAIHYNLVLALLNLDQPLEVHQHLLAAMRYGAEPLDHEKFEQAKAYKVLVEKQLARVKVSCDTPGTQVVMDGRPLFVAPEQFEGFVRAGPHSIVATKEGYLAHESSKALPAGETTVFDIKMHTTADLTQYRRKWAAWIPWTVLGAGVAVAAAGGGMHYSAAQGFKQFDAGIISCGGCVPSSELSGLRSSASLKQNVGLTSYVVGGAAIAAGGVLTWINRLLPYQTTPGEPGRDAALSVAPLLSGDANGVTAQLRF